MKIYFAGSIRGGRSDIRIYEQLIKHLRRHGEVLTEHVADPGISEKGKDGITDAEIYRKDMEWLSEADAVVAEVTTPSIGVGYEIGLAERLGKPILCLFNNSKIRHSFSEGGTKGKMLSAMVSGNPHILLRHYTESKEAKCFIDDFINHLSADSAKAQAPAGQESSEA